MSDQLIVGVSETTARGVDQISEPWLRFEVIGAHSRSVKIVWRRQHDRTAWLVSTLESVSSVRWVHTDTAGIDRLPLHLFIRRNIALSNSRGAHTAAVSEWAFAAVLLAAKRLDRVVRLSDERKWAPWLDSLQLSGRTIVILGSGSIGGALGRLCQAGGMRVVGVSRTRHRHQAHIDVPLSIDDDWLQELNSASFLVNCLPLTPLTKLVVNEHVLAQLPSHAWFVNVGRGDTVDEHSLVDAVRSGRLGGAVLDTVDNEPLGPDSSLWHRNIIISPHISSFTGDTGERTKELFIAEADRYRRGLALLNAVDFKRGY